MWHYPSRPHFWVPVFMVDDWSAALTYPGSVQDCFFCPCETSKLPAVAGGLPNPQTPNPTTPPPQPKLQTPPILKRAETYKRKFPGPVRPRACPHPVQWPPPPSKPLLPPCGPCTLPCLESNGTESSREVKCSLSALSWKSSQPPSDSSRLKSSLLHLKPGVLQSAAESTCTPDREAGREK